MKVYNRDFEAKIEDWYLTNSINTSLVVTGARQVGKTEGIKNWALNYNHKMLYLDLSRADQWIEDIIKADSYQSLVKLLCSIKGVNEKDIDVIFIDEIQSHSDGLSLCRLFRNQKIKFVCSGSLLGTKLSKPSHKTDVGSKIYLRVFPLSFLEFLKWTDNQKYIPMIDEAFANTKQIHKGFHQELMQLFYQFLLVGGMPNVVARYISEGKIFTSQVNDLKEGIYLDYLNDNQESFYSYDENKEATIKTIDIIFKKIDHFLIQPNNKRFIIDEVNKNFRYKNIAVPLEIIKNTNIALCSNKVNVATFPLEHHKIEEHFILYFNDVGIFTYRLKLNNEDLQLFKEKHLNSDIWGGIIENYVAQELQTESLFYWKERLNGRDYQVDFLFESKHGHGIVPCEVKSHVKAHSKATSLKKYTDKYHPTEIICIGPNNFSVHENKRFIPLYAVYKLKEIIK